MSRIRGKDTRPEMVVRRGLHSMGFRYSLHSRRLPGCPDLVLRRYHTVIFVNGCFWHGHPGCGKFRLPHSNVEFWAEKIRRNKERDAAETAALEALGWNVLTLAMIHPTCLHLCTKLLSKARKGDAIHPEKSALFTIY